MRQITIKYLRINKDKILNEYFNDKEEYFNRFLKKNYFITANSTIWDIFKGAQEQKKIFRNRLQKFIGSEKSVYKTELKEQTELNKYNKLLRLNLIGILIVFITVIILIFLT